MHQRRLGSVVLGVVMAHAALLAAETQPSCVLHAGRETGEISRVEAVLEVGGDLKVNHEGKTEPVKMSVVARFNYFERLVTEPSGSDRAWRSLRHYEEAEAVLKIGEAGGGKPRLSNDRRLIGVEAALPEVTLFSPTGPLTREELDLVDVLGNSLVLERLLPGKTQRVGDRWAHSATLMAALLGLDRASDSDVESELIKVEQGRALVQLVGKVEGRRDGVAATIEVKGKYQVDVRLGRVVWFGLLVNEQRPAGETAPGIDVVARLQMTIAPAAACDALGDKVLERTALAPTPDLLRLGYRSVDGQWEVLHDRAWHLTTEDTGQAVLRLVEENERLGQCNVATLAQVEPGRQAELEAFQKDVREALGESFQQFAAASQRANEQQYREIRVTAMGRASDVPIQWVYYLLSDASGRQVVLAFTVQADRLDRFAESDLELVRSFRFVDEKVALKPGTGGK